MSKITKKNITVYLQDETVKELSKLTKYYIFPNRSILINYCIDLAIPIINKELKFLKKNIKVNHLPNVLEYLKKHGFVIYHHIQPRNKVPLGNIHFNSNNKRKMVKVFK